MRKSARSNSAPNYADQQPPRMSATRCYRGIVMASVCVLGVGILGLIGWGPVLCLTLLNMSENFPLSGLR
jgi:hypothetical protein